MPLCFIYILMLLISPVLFTASQWIANIMTFALDSKSSMKSLRYLVTSRLETLYIPAFVNEKEEETVRELLNVAALRKSVYYII